MRRSLPLLSLLLLGCQNQPLEVASSVELERFQGRWYEIAKLPRPSQADCTSTTADYTLKSRTELLVVNECRLGSLTGPKNRVAARAVASDPKVPAKLSLNFGYAYGDYWILEVGEKYDYAVVGHPTRDYLWILSREPTLSEATLGGVVERAQANGFPVALLDYTKQQ